VSAPAAEAFLQELIRSHGGSLPVARFMREALYHPEHGYYGRHIRTVGRGGDFSTTPTLHAALGRGIAAWALGCREGIGRQGRWHLVEIGAGDGTLAGAVLDALGFWARRRVVYHIVEASPPLRERQEERLRGRPVVWYADVAAALDASSGRALLVSNELADAFPAAVYRWSGSEWREVCLSLADRRIVEVDGAPHGGTGAIGGETWSTALGRRHPFAVGQRVEVAFAWREWLAGWVGCWTEGRMLTIDYGDTFPALYHRRPDGTLRAYLHHERLTGPEVYARFGRQDLTADVNFSDLQAWGEALGLETISLRTLGDFLLEHEPKLAREAAGDVMLARLLNPDGAGGAFKVLEQGRPRLPSASG
jgi:SAM-dependent MidA family methyltransferase